VNTLIIFKKKIMLGKRGVTPSIPSIGSPKFVKGIHPVLQFNTKAALFSQESETFIPVSMLLWKLTFNHETFSKRVNIALIDCTLP